MSIKSRCQALTVGLFVCKESPKAGEGTDVFVRRKCFLPSPARKREGVRTAWSGLPIWLYLLLLFMLAGGCAVGPDFKRTAPPSVRKYTQGEETTETVSADGLSQRFQYGARIVEDYWRLFKSPVLDSLIKEALAENSSIQSELARLRRSCDSLRAGYGAFFPQIDGGFSATRKTLNLSGYGLETLALGNERLPNIYSVFTARATISYALDIFGAQRRTVEDLGAQADYQKYTALGACLTLTGNIVSAAIAQAAYRAQIEATEKIIALEKEVLEITENQVRAGVVPYVNGLSIRAQLTSTEATLPGIKNSLQQSQHLLAALLGRAPAEWESPLLDLADFALPTDLPVTLPCDLVRQRPDILAAEARIHGATAQIGVATANMLPNLSLSGSIGQSSDDIATLFAGSSNLWNIGGSLTGPLFNGGTLWFQRRAAIDAYEEATASYRQIVVSAFQQVADALRAVEHDAETLRTQSEALAIAEELLGVIKGNYEAGRASYLEILTAENQYNIALIGTIHARMLRLQDTAGLFTALGGGWWNTESQMAIH